MSNERGCYGSPRVGARSSNLRGYPPHVGAEPAPRRSNLPWLLGSVGLVAVGIAVLGAYAKSKQQPRLSAHEKEVQAWEAEFPGLPWYMDQVKDARQLDLWERARDHWERTH